MTALQIPEDPGYYERDIDGNMIYDKSVFEWNDATDPLPCYSSTDITDCDFNVAADYDFTSWPCNANICAGDIIINIRDYDPAQPFAKEMVVISECCQLSVPLIYVPKLTCPPDDQVPDPMNPGTSPIEVCHAAGYLPASCTDCESCDYDATDKADEHVFYGGTLTTADGFEFYNYGFVDYMVAVFKNIGIINQASTRTTLTATDLTELEKYLGDEYINTADATATANNLTYLDEMIFHMIHDQYGANPLETPAYQYTCGELVDCWQGAIELVIDSKSFPASDFEINNPVDEMNQDSEVDFDMESDIENAVEQAFNEMTFGFILKMFGKKKREEQIEDAVEDAKNKADQTVAAYANIGGAPEILTAFFECAGYNFARVLPSTSTTVSCDVSNTVNNLTVYGGRDNTLWGGGTPSAAFFKVFQFKYFEYERSSKPQCETNYCFCPNTLACGPNATPLVNGQVMNTCQEDFEYECDPGFDHFDWTFEQREDFFICINDDINRDDPATPITYQNTMCEMGDLPIENTDPLLDPMEYMQEATITFDALRTEFVGSNCVPNLISVFLFSSCPAGMVSCVESLPILSGVGQGAITTAVSKVLNPAYPNNPTSIFSPFHPNNPLPGMPIDFNAAVASKKCKIYRHIYMNIRSLDVMSFISYLNGDITWEDLDNETQGLEDECMAKCDQREPEFEEKVERMFIENCWSIVNDPCATYQAWEVPVQDLTLIASQLKDHCKVMCTRDFVAGQSKVCTDCDGANNYNKYYMEVYEGSPEELQRWNSVVNGDVQLDIASWCDEEDNQDISLNIDRTADCGDISTNEIRTNAAYIDYDVSNIQRCDAEDSQLEDRDYTHTNTPSNTIFISEEESKNLNLEIIVPGNP